MGPAESNPPSSNPPFRILRAESREELDRLLHEAEAEGWSLLGTVTQTQVGEEQRYYCQVVSAAGAPSTK